MVSTDRLNGVRTSLAVKAAVEAVATSNITLSGTQTVGGVAVVANDRVLVAGQTDASENGIYDVATGTWTRSPDFDGNNDAKKGTLVVIGSTPLVGFYQLTYSGTLAIGTTDLTFTLIADMDIAGNLALTTTGQGAALVGVEDADGDWTATKVEGILAEIGDLFAGLGLNVTGSFTATLTGYASGPTGTVKYSINGNLCTLWIDEAAAITGTSNAVFMAMTGMPAAIKPTFGKKVPCVGLQDNGTDDLSGMLNITDDGGFFDFLLVDGANFTNSGAKGLTDGWTVTYILD